jgi:hypothetical protein
MKNTYPVSLAILLTAALAAVPMAADAQAETVDFSGIVTSSSNAPSVLDGMTITGTYTIDLANGNPYSGSGSVNYFAPWVYAVGPSPDGNPVGSAYVEPGPVFASTAQVGTFSYASVASPLFPNGSEVTGAEQGESYFAYETATPSSSFSSSSSFQIMGNLAYSPAGIPLFGHGSTGTGDVIIDVGGVQSVVDYNIKSITAAPEMDPASVASALTLLFGGLAVLRGRRRENRLRASSPKISS